jgi:uncharacterized cupin superfamily protein
MTDLIVMKTKGRKAPKAERAAADPATLLRGKYKTKTWNHFSGEDGRLSAGIWECTPGKVTISYDEWEFCHLIKGKAVLTGETGKKWTLKAGDAFIIPPGFKGTWETVSKLRKHYVILAPRS